MRKKTCKNCVVKNIVLPLHRNCERQLRSLKIKARFYLLAGKSFAPQLSSGV